MGSKIELLIILALVICIVVLFKLVFKYVFNSKTNKSQTSNSSVKTNDVDFFNPQNSKNTGITNDNINLKNKNKGIITKNTKFVTKDNRIFNIIDMGNGELLVMEQSDFELSSTDVLEAEQILNSQPLSDITDKINTEQQDEFEVQIPTQTEVAIQKNLQEDVTQENLETEIPQILTTDTFSQEEEFSDDQLNNIQLNIESSDTSLEEYFEDEQDNI